MGKPYTCYVINLDRSEDRLKAISANLAELNQPFTRIRAHDGMAYSPDDITKFYDGKYSPSYGGYIKNTWVCITLSHVDAMKAFLASDSEYGVIMEDDVRIGSETLQIIDYLCNRHKEGLIVFDEAELIGPNNAKRMDLVKPIAEFNGYAIGRVSKTAPLAACMLYTRDGAKKLLNRALPLKTHWDNYLSLSWFHGARAITVRPFPAWHTDGNVSVPASDAVKKPSFQDKLYRRLFSIYQGPRRFFYDLYWMGIGYRFGARYNYVRYQRKWKIAD